MMPTQRGSDELMFKDLLAVQERKADVYRWIGHDLQGFQFLDPASVKDIHTELQWLNI